MRGVRQGDPLSPKLFSAVLEQIFRKVCFENCGIVLDGARLSHLRFADDLVILSNKPDQLQGMVQQISDESKKKGLQMNTEKTKVMTNRQKIPIKIDQGIIEYVDEYVYLGQIISVSDIMDKEVDRRIANAWKRYWGLKEVMKNKNLSMAPKRKLFDTCILPVLTYGCQTWALTKKQLSKLKVCQHSMERSMMGVKRKDKKRLDEIRGQTRIEDITVKIRKLKWKWTGHMMRGKDKWSRTATIWYPRDHKRKRGRQFKRWVDEIVQIAGKTWTRLAMDREKWKMLEEAFAKRQTD
jgi:hypothetical protein